MNICKERFNNRTKSLREKFSRHRSYSELSLKNVPILTHTDSTETEGVIEASSTSSHNPFSNKLKASHPHPPSVVVVDRTEYQPFSSDSYGSALDLSQPTAPCLGDILVDKDTNRFPWQQDVAIQCSLLVGNIPLITGVNVDDKKSNKKPSLQHHQLSASSSSASFAINAPTNLMNVATATLRNITDHHSIATLHTTSAINNDGIGAGSGGGRFWKSSTSITGSGGAGNSSPFLFNRKSFRWPTTNVKQSQSNSLLLKRAASFHNGNSGKGYSRLVQSTSSPSSPELMPDDILIMSTDRGLKTKSPESASNNNDDHIVVRPTTLLGASAAMTAVAPVSSSINKSNNLINKHHSYGTEQVSKLDPKSSSSYYQKNFARESNTINPDPDPDDDDDDDENNSMRMDINFIKTAKMTTTSSSSLSAAGKNGRVDAAPASEAACSVIVVDDDGSNDEYQQRQQQLNSTSTTATENELYNFDTVNRLMNISLQAASSRLDENNLAIKPFILDLPHSVSCGSGPPNDSTGRNSGSNRAQSYMNLPSPNIQSEIQDVNPVLRKLSALSRSPERVLLKRACQQTNTVGIGGSFRRAKQPISEMDVLDDDNLEDYYLDDQDSDDSLLAPDEQSLKRRPRRRALIPPKLITDDHFEQTLVTDNNSQQQKTESNFNYELTGPDQMKKTKDDSTFSGHSHHHLDLANVGKGQHLLGANLNSIPSPTSPSSNNSHGSGQKNRRRSSVVVIPPMQICPGDLLVYSKVLTQRANLMERTGMVSSLLTEQDQQRKSHKSNTWSLLRLFDRSNSRQKLEQIIGGMEEFLSSLQPSNSFMDETMLRFKGISWNDFVSRIGERKHSTNRTTASLSVDPIDSTASAPVDMGTVDGGAPTTPSRFTNGARFSSLQSNVLEDKSNMGLNDCPICHRNEALFRSQSLSKVISFSMERIKPSIDDQPVTLQKKPIREQSILAKNMPRNDSINTESEVESLAEHEAVILPEQISDAKYCNTGPGVSNIARTGSDILERSNIPSTDAYCRECFKQFKREKRRREALWELFQSELHFLIDHLMVLKNVFMEPLKNIQVEGYAMFAEPEVLFGNLDELCLLVYAFCKEFLNLLINQVLVAPSDQPDAVQVTQVLERLYLKNKNRAKSMTQAFHRYTLNYINALQYLETLRRQVEFTEFEKWCNRDPRCKKLQLTDLLVTPVQHVMRLPLLLKEIDSKTQNAEEKRILADIIDRQQNSLRELDDKMRWLKNFERLLEIQRNIIWPSVIDMEPKIFVPEFLKSFLAKQPCERLIVSPRRQIVLEGPLMILDSGKPVEMYVFLFDDLLLITRRKKSLGKKQSTLTERWVSNCGGRTSSLSSVVGSPGTSVNVVAAAASVAAAKNTSGPGGSSSSNRESVLNAQQLPQQISQSQVSCSGAAGTQSQHSSGNPSSNLLMMNTAVAAGEPNHGPVINTSINAMGVGGNSVPFKFIVYKQPLSLDRFYIHDIPQPDTSSSGVSLGVGSGGSGSVKNGFVLVCLNRFQQVITVHTFQAASEMAKNTWLSKLRSTCDRWKRLLQSNTAFRANTNMANGRRARETKTSERKTSTNTLREEGMFAFDEKIAKTTTNNDKNDQYPKQQKRSSFESMNSVAASISYHIDDSQATTSTFT